MSKCDAVGTVARITLITRPESRWIAGREYANVNEWQNVIGRIM